MNRTLQRVWRPAILAGIVLCTFTSAAPARDDVAALTRDEQSARRYSDELRKAWDLYQRSDLREALALFEQVANRDDVPDPDYAQALFGIGLCHRFLRPTPDPAAARQAFEELAERFPNNPAAPWALIELGCLANRKEPGGGVDARPLFRRVMEEYPDSPAIHEAALRLANTYFYELDPPLANRAVDILEAHLERHPDNPLSEVMLFRLDYWYAEVRQDYGRSILYAEELGRRRMSDPFRWSRQYWHIAETYRMKLDQPRKAVPWYLRIIRETPRSYHTLAAKKRLEAMGIDWEEALHTDHQPGTGGVDP